MTPDAYRKDPKALNRMTKPELLLHYTLIDEGVPLITDGIVLEVTRRENTEPVYFTGVKKDMPIQFIDGLGIESWVDSLDTLWRNFHEQKQAALGLSENNEEIGVAYPCLDEGHFSYFAGAKSKQGEVPDGFINWELPPREYIVCFFEAAN